MSDKGGYASNVGPGTKHFVSEKDTARGLRDFTPGVYFFYVGFPNSRLLSRDRRTQHYKTPLA